MILNHPSNLRAAAKPGRCVRRTLTLLAALALTLAGAAQSENAPDPDTSLESIASSIEKVELLKRGLAPKEELSLGSSIRFPTPALTDADPTPTILLSADAAGSAERENDAWRQENWLVAGMEAVSQTESMADDFDPAADTPAKGTPEHWLLMTDSATTADNALIRKASRDDKPKLAVKVVNPLERFMTEWLDASLAADGFTRVLGTPVLSALGDVARPSAVTEAFDLSNLSSMQGLGINRADQADKDRINPYAAGLRELPVLSDLTGVLPGITAPANLPGAADLLAFPIPSNPAITAPPDAAKSTREPWRPPEKPDEKYFRRLNQF